MKLKDVEGVNKNYLKEGSGWMKLHFQ